MKTKNFLLVAAIGAIAATFFHGQSAVKKPSPALVKTSAPSAATPSAEVVPVNTEMVSVNATENISTSPAPEKITAQPSEKKSGQKNFPKPKEPIQDPDARTALSLVGADSEAEAYWLAAINDPSLPANERQNLIEDLNEDGLSNPKHPGPQDMPLILSRIQLIESFAPTAMDQVNADAFQEAYKDLVKMLNGQSVQ